MNKRELLGMLEMILNEVHTAVLATADREGRPHLRWMTPALISGREGTIFAVTSPGFEKLRHLEVHPEVEWLFQTPLMDTVVTVRGRMNVVDNPSILSEVLEALGPHMHSFWRLKGEERDLWVLETIIEEAVCYWPLRGRKEVVKGW